MASKAFAPVRLRVGIALFLLASLVFLPPVGASGRRTEAELRSQDGTLLGTVDFVETEGAGIKVEAKVSGLAPGFHGFHIHSGGACVGDFVASAGGHYVGAGSIHGDHDGDLPSLLVAAGGQARMEFVTDRLTLDEVVGRTVIVHAGRDNYANIPLRYHSHDEDVFGPDSPTKSTGDAGSRFGCGVIEEAS